ncbi:hypothetical protein LCM20_05730 [Halobacillus litoralis]|uniref:hypothetical protein n=1 Tax=Halobacillus litoralis TaxID=45668 RepID=UPI001CD24353|nr:hypothetical protein [Halobacillus litoralis]MCA0970077.1 hypothetical protein [Halobacillus litoralis]
MKHTVRSFSLGLLTATTILGITYYLEEPELPAPAEPVDAMGTEEMIQQIEEDGYRVLTQQDVQSLKEPSQPEPSEPDQHQADQVQEIYVYTLDIVPGTTSEDISQKLANAGLIDEAETLEQYMVVNDYSRFIQVGQATIRSDMTLSEMAQAITSK